MKIFIPDTGCVSFDKINNDLKEYLKKNSHEIAKYKKWPIDDNEIFIQHYLSIRRELLKPLRKAILIQPIDGTIITKKNVSLINKWNLIVTPASIGKKIMIDCGVTSPIKVIPNYWEDELLIDNGFFSTLFTEKKWTFYTESSGWDRKNVENILKYFIEEFKDESGVRLVIKLSEKRLKLQIPTDIKCEIVVIDDFISKSDIYSLMHGCDCYVCLSYMEGFCIPILNAAVLKKDIICLDSKWSGYTDFLNKDNSIMIPCHEIPIIKGVSLSIYETFSVWEEADYQKYKHGLRCSFKQSYKFEKKDSFDNFHIDHVMSKYLELIN